jgi:hypothetical protein
MMSQQIEVHVKQRLTRPSDKKIMTKKEIRVDGPRAKSIGVGEVCEIRRCRDRRGGIQAATKQACRPICARAWRASSASATAMPHPADFDHICSGKT